MRSANERKSRVHCTSTPLVNCVNSRGTAGANEESALSVLNPILVARQRALVRQLALRVPAVQAVRNVKRSSFIVFSINLVSFKAV